MLAQIQEVSFMELLEVRNVSKIFESGIVRKIVTKAVDNVSFAVKRGEAISIVGQSGSGKTTLAKMILRLLEPSSGAILFEGKDVWRDIRGKNAVTHYYRNVHAVFQDPYSSFNPFYKIDRTLNQALRLIGIDPDSDEGKYRVREALTAMGLRPENILEKYPHQLSGGQLQRVLIARSWIIKPKLLIADEPVSMLDVSTRGKIVSLFKDLRDNLGTSVIFITHDLGLAYVISDRIIVMYQGRIVEEGKPDDIIERPRSEFTKRLIESVPTLYEKWKDI